MPRIPAEELEDLKKNIDLAALVRAKGVELKQYGKHLKGLCPFHNDTSPSLVVTPSKNEWNCFGCQAGGDVIAWVQKAEGVSFRHAVELLRDGHASRLVTSKIAKHSTVPRLPAPVDPSADDELLMKQVIGFYHDRLKASPEALAYLDKRGIRNAEAIDKFKLGYADRSLGLRLEQSNRKNGGEIRGRLKKIGIYRESGHGHFNGSLVIPVIDAEGTITEVYGRKINDNLRAGTPLHLYLPGPHKGIWNAEALDSAEVILCESLIDALTFWVNGFHNVTAGYGVQGFTEDHLAGFLGHNVKRVYIAYDRDEAGDRAAEKLAEKLMSEGIECYRVKFPMGMDANAYACKARPADQSLDTLIRSSAWMGQGEKKYATDVLADLPIQTQPSLEPRPPLAAPLLPPAAKEGASAAELRPPQEKTEAGSSIGGPTAGIDLPVTVAPDGIRMSLGDRMYRVRGLEKNLSFEVMKITVSVFLGEKYHVDNLDLYNARHRTAFINAAAEEIGVRPEVVKSDIGTVMRKLEELQEQQIAEALAPKQTEVTLTDEEREEALELLRDPNLLDRIAADFERCGLVGERTNVLVGYLAAISRKFEKPLAIMIQSSTAAGKSTLMDAILDFIPEEDMVKYTAMTGQSLFYMGETELSHKTLAISEDEGAEKAKYAIKTMQSEKELRIASTGKDPKTGKLVTETYEVKGPIQVLFTTTAVELDEELQNRCIVLTVNEDREQTRAIHRMQREEHTLEGLRRSADRDDILKLHRNAQRLLTPVRVHNPYARDLTFLDDKLRTRRDNKKYLVLIDSICFLRQYQRTVLTDRGGNKPFDYIEATFDDIEIANGLANEVLGRTLDELSPQTRNFLMCLDGMVTAKCREKCVERQDYRFSRRDIRAHTSNWCPTQVHTHMKVLEEMEYVLLHRGNRGYKYELLYNGEGRDEQPFMMGLIDVAKLRGMYDEKHSGETTDLSGQTGENSARIRVEFGHDSAPNRAPYSRSNHVQPGSNGSKSADTGKAVFGTSYAQARHSSIPLAAKGGEG